jgi:hypothetical protein
MARTGLADGTRVVHDRHMDGQAPATGDGGRTDSEPVEESARVRRATLELRIHGVHGTSPDSMLGLGTGSAEQVAGDGLTGIFRSPDGTLPYRELPDEVAVEAYSWGALTSGIGGFLGWVKRALWLLLLPFALVNLAYWARLELGRPGWTSRLGAAAVRVSGFLLTVFFMLSACFVFLDLFAWQCYRDDTRACSRVPGWFDVLATLPPGQRLAIGMVGPVLVVLVLYALARTSLARYEETNDPDRTQPLGEHADQDPIPILRHPNMWSSARRTRSLRNAHLAAALATIVLSLVIHLLWMGQAREGWQWPAAIALAVLDGLLFLGVAVFAVRRIEGDVELLHPPVHATGWEAEQALRWSYALLSAAVVTTALLVLVLVSQPAAAYDQLQDYRGHNALFVIVFVLLTVAHLSVFCAERLPSRAAKVLVLLGIVVVVGGGALVIFTLQGKTWLGVPVGVTFSVVAGLGLLALGLWHFVATREDHESEAWNGAGASVLLAAGVWVALLFATTLVTGAANYLNGDASAARLTTTLEPRRTTDSHDGVPVPVPVGAQDTAAGSPPERRDITVKGTVTLDSADAAELERSGTVRAGHLTVDTAWLTASPKGSPFFLDSRKLDSGTITLSEAEVRLSDGCKCRIVTPDTKTFAFTGGMTLKVTDPGHPDLVLPPVLVWSSIALLAWLIAVLLALLACLLAFGRSVGRSIKEATGDYFRGTTHGWQGTPFPVPPVVPEVDREPVRRARTRAALAHRAEQLLNVTGATTAPIALLLVAFSSRGDAPWEAWPWLKPVATIALFAVAGASAGLIALGAKVRDSEGWRRGLGVLWDLTTFWPRAAHPLGPPCYAERVVPEVSTRLSWALDDAREPAKRVIVSAHSQGSTIAVAVLTRRARLENVYLVTYGSQIRGLYGRVFPRVFGPDDVGYQPTEGPTGLTDPFPDLPRPATHDVESPQASSTLPRASLRGRLGADHWVNLFRRADPLGYRVFSDAFDDASDRVVLEVPIEEYGDPGPVVQAHSGYQHTPEYRALISSWTGEPFVAPPVDPSVLSPLPEP